MAPDRHPRCPGAPPAKVRGHPTPIAPATGGERFSPTRFSLTGADPAAETTRRGLCAAPPSEKRYTLSRREPLGPEPTGGGERKAVQSRKCAGSVACRCRQSRFIPHRVEDQPHLTQRGGYGNG